MEENQTQELTRFDKFAYVLGVRKRDFCIDSIINTIASITYEEDSFLYLYRRNPRRIKFLIGLVFNSEHFPNSAQIRLSVDRPVDQPRSWSTVPNRELSHVSQLTGRSIGSFCDQPGGRPRWPVHAPGRPVSAAAVSSLPWLPRVDFLSLPTSPTLC